MIYIAISYFSIGFGFALGMVGESLARDGRLFESRSDIWTLPLAIVGWLPVMIIGVVTEYQTARRLNRSFFMK